MLLIRDTTGQVESITIRRPSNFHAHFRDDAMMRAVTEHLIRIPRYVLAMPNTGPITTLEEAVAYHQRLRSIADDVADHQVDFIMTLYLTDKITPEVIETMARSSIPLAVKYYPPQPGATTGSGVGGIPLDQCHELLTAMTAWGVPLLGHFEAVEDKDGRPLSPEEREGYMVDNFLWEFRDKYPHLRISFEHASTEKAVQWVGADDSGNSFMTVTPQHSLFIAPNLETFGVDLDCMPIVKKPADREAIVKFITSGDRRVGAGGDEAPHPHQAKLKGSKGCWTPHAPEMYAEVFDDQGALDERFERFMSLNAPDWWELLPPNEKDTVTFTRQSTPVPEPIRVPELDDVIVPLGWSQDGTLYNLKFQVT